MRMIRALIAAMLPGVSLAAIASAQAAPYTVEHGRIRSAMQPGIIITVDTMLEYVGSQRFELYGVAQAEQHLFAKREGGRVVRFLWVQFEEYLPSSNGRYDYSRSPVVTMSGRPFHADKELWNVPATERRPGSDGAQARALLRANRLTLAPTMLYERLVWLPDSSNRRELMIIYAEDLATTGHAASDLEGSPEKTQRLAGLLQGLESRAARTFAISGQ